MTPGKSLFRRKPNARELRMLFYLVVVIGIAAWRFIPRPWHPTLTKTTPYHLIYSTATTQQTDATAWLPMMERYSPASIFAFSTL
jgi:hypothetical protein